MQYRKKAVVVEAFQVTAERRFNNVDWPKWLHEAWNRKEGTPGSLYPSEVGTSDDRLAIGTLEGQLLVSWGDWIIRGVAGELYPCKPEIFEATYEPIKINEKEMDKGMILRPEVARFAELMEIELQERRYKGGQYHNHKTALIKQLLEAVGELIGALDDNISPVCILSEAADVANIAMRIAETQTKYNEWSVDELIVHMRP